MPSSASVAAQYEPSLADWVNAIQDNPAYILSFLLYHWPWLAGILAAIAIAWIIPGKSNTRATSQPLPNNNWGEAARRTAAQEKNTEEELTRAQKEAKAKDAKNRRLHNEGIEPINRVVAQFVRAVRQAGSPELLVKKDGHWEKAIAFKGFRDGKWRIEEKPGGSTHIVEVFTDGSWEYMYWREGVIGSGPGGDMPCDMRSICAQSYWGTPETPEDYENYAVSIQDILTLFLRRHKIPLPED